MFAVNDHAERGYPRSVPGTMIDSGRALKIQSLHSKRNFTAAAKRPVPTRARAFSMPSDPEACMALMVSAHCTPEGNFNCSALMRLRLSGMATTTPSTEIARSHAVRRSPVSSGMVMVPSARSIVSAGMELTRPAEDMYAAAEAAVCEVLFSSIESGRIDGKTFETAEKIAKASTLEVMLMPKLQPILRPM